MHGREAAPVGSYTDPRTGRNEGIAAFLPRAFAPTAARLELVSPFLETAQFGTSRRTLRRNLGIFTEPSAGLARYSVTSCWV
jgi:hypothetical protein